MTPRDFCIWLEGYLSNNGKPEYSVDFRSPIEEKLKTVDMSISPVFNPPPPMFVPTPNWQQPWYSDKTTPPDVAYGDPVK